MRDRIVDLLERRGGYTLAPEPLHILDAEFKFPAVLQGPANNPGLVVLLDESESSISSALRRLRAFRTVLSRTGKRRPITTVLLDAGIQPESLSELRAISRVLVVGQSDTPEIALRPLFPLELPDVEAYDQNVDDRLAAKLSLALDSPLTRRLLSASEKGPDDVRKALRKAVDDVAREALKAVEEMTDD